MLRQKSSFITACLSLVCLAAALLLASFSGAAQERYSRHDNFSRGVREGGHGGDYYDPRHARDGYDERYREQRGGIGPGKGAAIGGAGGAILGAVLGGGLKGSLIGGAAGAGIGAVLGETNQNHH